MCFKNGRAGFGVDYWTEATLGQELGRAALRSGTKAHPCPVLSCSGCKPGSKSQWHADWTISPRIDQGKPALSQRDVIEEPSWRNGGQQSSPAHVSQFRFCGLAACSRPA